MGFQMELEVLLHRKLLATNVTHMLLQLVNLDLVSLQVICPAKFGKCLPA